MARSGLAIALAKEWTSDCRIVKGFSYYAWDGTESDHWYRIGIKGLGKLGNVKLRPGKISSQ